MDRFHFPRARKGRALSGSVVSALVTLIVGTGAPTAVENIRDTVSAAGYEPYVWFTAPNVAHWWWVPLLLCVIFLVWGFWPAKKPQSAAPSKGTGVDAERLAPLTVEDYFKNDFPDAAAFIGSLSVTFSDGVKIDIPAQVFFDPEAHANFAAIYAPFHAGASLWALPAIFMEQLPKLMRGSIQIKGPSDHDTVSSANAVFTGRLYVYHEATLSHEEIAELSRSFREHGVPSVIFRGWEYARLENARRA